MIRSSGCCSLFLAASLFLIPSITIGAPPDVQTIIQKSVEANQVDFKADPNYSYKERDRTPDGVKTFQVTMIDGSPYRQLIAINGKPLTGAAAQQEQSKLQQEKARRDAESVDERNKRIAKYESDRNRDNAMMQQLTEAFTFKLIGQRTLNGFHVYQLQAIPRPGYSPPNMETQVLTGMQGELWIDTNTYQWVKVTARVIHPVSIEGFLAQVEPGTEFELEKMPVANGIWEAKHFSMKSNAKILHIFNHNSQEDDTFFDYTPANNSGQPAGR